MNPLWKGLSFLAIFCGIVIVCMLGTLFAYNQAKEGHLYIASTPGSSQYFANQNSLHNPELLMSDRYI